MVLRPIRCLPAAAEGFANGNDRLQAGQLVLAVLIPGDEEQLLRLEHTQKIAVAVLVAGLRGLEVARTFLQVGVLRLARFV